MPGEGKRMMPAHWKIMDLELGGLTRGEIAGVMNRSPEGVGLVMSGQVYQDEIARRRESLTQKKDSGLVNHLQLTRETLEQASLDAAELLQEQIGDGSLKPEIRQSAADKVLNAAFGRGKGEDDSQGKVTIVTIEQLQVLNLARTESGEMRMVGVEG